ncbi:MAG TPA: hypothetical protein ENN79_12540 [Desulfobacteraceae bacterium]|nr:hypothetical protein [Desulfobacteraceae bacterium]
MSKANRLKKHILSFVIFLIWLCIAPPYSPAAEIDVGLVVPLTGKLAPAGRAVRNGALLAVEEINQTGGISGNRLHAVITDTSSSPAGAAAAVKALVEEERVLVLAGGCGSSSALAAGFEAEENQIPLLVTTAADDRITEQGWQNLFRLNAPASEHTKALEGYLSGLVNRNSTAAVIFERGPLGDYGLKRFFRLQRRLGFRIISRVGYDPPRDDFREEILRIKGADPDIICFICRAHEGAVLLRQVKEAGFESSVLLAGTGDLLTPAFRELEGGAAEGLLGAAWWVPHVGYPGAAIFRENFIRRHNTEPDYWSAQGYSAMWVVADAIDRADKLDRAGIRASLEKTNLMTAYGPVKFEDYVHKKRQNRLPSLAVRWQRGLLRVVWPRNVAEESIR